MTIEERIERLERQNPYLRIGVAAVGGLAGSLLVAAMAAVAVFVVFVGAPASEGVATPQALPDVLRAKAFHLVSDDGKTLVKIEDTLGDRTGLVGTITTFNGKGQMLVKLGATTAGDGMITTRNGEGQKLVALGVTTGGGGGVVTYNGKGQELIKLGTTAGGEGAVVTRIPWPTTHRRPARRQPHRQPAGGEGSNASEGGKSPARHPGRAEFTQRSRLPPLDGWRYRGSPFRQPGYRV